jgi:hypothetical protein
LRRARILLFCFLRQIAHQNLGEYTTWEEIAQEFAADKIIYTHSVRQKAAKFESQIRIAALTALKLRYTTPWLIPGSRAKPSQGSGNLYHWHLTVALSSDFLLP